METGGGNVVLGGDIENWATGVHVTGRGNQIQGFMEGNTVAVNFDNSVFSAAADNILMGYCAACTVSDTGTNNRRLDAGISIPSTWLPSISLSTGVTGNLPSPSYFGNLIDATSVSTAAGLWRSQVARTARSKTTQTITCSTRKCSASRPQPAGHSKTTLSNCADWASRECWI